MNGRRVSPYLIRRIPEVVAEPRWCGGLSHAELAGELRESGRERVFVLSLVVCFTGLMPGRDHRPDRNTS